VTTDPLINTHPRPRVGLIGWLAILAGALVIAFLIYQSVSHPGDHDSHEVVHAPPAWGIGIIPFIGILGCIAILPLVRWTQHWWESNRNRLIVALIVAGLTLVYTFCAGDGWADVVTVLDHSILVEYIPFIILLFSLYVISGGICVTGDLPARPLTNTIILAIGAIIASFIGTTGASMLLIRPLLKTNSERKHVVHTVVFFIFLVSNIGGCLLPIGDPPLFLGYLYGVPFLWTLGLGKAWAVCCVVLLVIYYIIDRLAWRRETPSDIQRDASQYEPVRVRGWVNLPCLLGVMLAVALVVEGRSIPLLNFEAFLFLRELIMLGFVALSLLLTPRGVREHNHFNYAAILEVAALFLGIFIAMQVPIQVLQAQGPFITEHMTEPWQYFWATGMLSSFLDNAPTYVVFFELAQTMSLPPDAPIVELRDSTKTIGEAYLAMISLGAVFMGAMTYIGNGPNFMVKAIAEQAGVPMPSFFGYMVKYSIPVLIPVFILIILLGLY
jgi:Na+/H+ antiporter NhaD/arsenite permease-like protein